MNAIEKLMTSSYDVFISYAQSDVEMVTAVAEVLANAGLRVWFDRWSMVPGSVWTDSFSDALKKSKSIVAFVGGNSLIANQSFELGLWQGANPGSPAIIALLPNAKAVELFPMQARRIVNLRDFPETTGLADLVDAIQGALQRSPAYEFPSHDLETTLVVEDELKLRNDVEEKLKRGDSSPEVILSLRRLSDFRIAAGAPSEAVEDLRKALALTERGSDPHEELAEIYSELGNALRLVGRPSEAEHFLRIAIELYEQQESKQRGVAYGFTLNNLGGVLQSTGRYREARRLYESAVAITEQHYGRSSNNYASAVNNLANVLSKDPHTLEEAERLYREALDVARNNGEGSRRLASIIDNLSGLLRLKGEYDEAERLSREAVSMLQGHRDGDRVLALMNLAKLLRQLDRANEALPLDTEAVEIAEIAFAAGHHPLLAMALNGLALSMLAVEPSDRTELIAKRSVDITRNTYGRFHPALATTLATLGAIEAKLNKFDDAIDAFKGSLEILSSVYGADDRRVRVAEQKLKAVRDLKARGA